jgi:hypothetical protein
MNVTLSILAIFVGWLSAFMPAVISLTPWLGPQPSYHLKTIRAVVAVIALGLAAWAIFNAPGLWTGIAGLVTLLFTFLSLRLLHHTIFTTLDYPPRVAGQAAKLGDQAMVLGFESGGEANAWPLEAIIPHHLVNDRIANNPILVAY